MSLSGTNNGEISEHDLESVRDRAGLREEMKGDRRAFNALAADYKETKHKVGKLMKLRTEVYLITALFVAIMGTGAVAIPWLVKNAVRDVLLADGIVRFERR